MVPFRDIFLQKFKAETGINANYHETNYDAWYQNSKTDGLQKTGAYDIYVMDDNWVPEYAARRDRPEPRQARPQGQPGHPGEGARAGLLAAQVRPAAEGVCQRHARALLARDHRRRRDPVLQQGLLPDGARHLGRHLQRREDQVPSAEPVRLVAARCRRQPDRADVPAAAQLLRRQLRQRRLVAGLRRPRGRRRARAAVRVHPVHADPASPRSTPARRPRSCCRATARR